MRIVHWAPQFGSETGTGKAIAGWLGGIAICGHDCTVVATPSPLNPAIPAPRIRVRSHPDFLQRLRIFGQEIKTSHIVHLHGAFDFKLCAIHLIVAMEKIWRMFTGQPLHIVMTPHGALSDDVFANHPRRKLAYWHLVERLLAKQTSLAICTTPVEADALRKLLPEMRVGVVPLVVSDDDLHLPATHEAPAYERPGIPTLCTLGRYDIRTKGLDILIKTVRNLNEGGFPIRLRCIGYDAGGGTLKLEKYVKSVDAEHCVECVGPRFGMEKFQILATSDVFCLPSRYESFSYALLEGLGSGRPVLVGSGACLTSFFDSPQKDALVVEPEIASWERAIRNTLANPGKNIECAERALADLRERCSTPAVGDALGYHYQSIFAEVTALDLISG